uniref:Uncharacterized protein n=1 Tax=Oryza rufipogon TaxID=4529 RepID=A0A0E0PH60_ORYRU
MGPTRDEIGATGPEPFNGQTDKRQRSSSSLSPSESSPAFRAGAEEGERASQRGRWGNPARGQIVPPAPLRPLSGDPPPRLIPWWINYNSSLGKPLEH